MVHDNREATKTKYIIQVKDHLDTHWQHWFEEMKITLVENGVTILSGELTDQAALHGLLEKIHSLNLKLISVQMVDSDEKTARG